MIPREEYFKGVPASLLRTEARMEQQRHRMSRQMTWMQMWAWRERE
jgi:hypothetical protein